MVRVVYVLYVIHPLEGPTLPLLPVPHGPHLLLHQFQILRRGHLEVLLLQQRLQLVRGVRVVLSLPVGQVLGK